MIELKDIPRGSTLRLTVEEIPNTKCTFHHLDGMYSYCTVDEGPRGPADGKPGGIFHLYIFEKLRLVGDHYVLAGEES